ncbi:MAG: hypothetical protein KVP17_004269 [Porospora cf. gigantea B]|uniref:uncharacterized protein n=1 Tax=Porospora cf. gigantea B TaxID=2853592 RepID=UPI003571907A|nr:MAG: hypothetical protein KVP17_004269 [Porospora cf. gigantea B]
MPGSCSVVDPSLVADEARDKECTTPATGSVTPNKAVDVVDSVVVGAVESIDESAEREHTEPFGIPDEPILMPFDLERGSETLELTRLSGTPAGKGLSDHDLALLYKSLHPNVFHHLGYHLLGDDTGVIRVWRVPSSSPLFVRPTKTCNVRLRGGDADGWVPMTQHSECLYEIYFHVVSGDRTATCAYEIKTGDQLLRDAYNFGLQLPEFDLKLFQGGSCWTVANLLGSHVITLDGVSGVRFAVWAPNAQIVRVVGDFNTWDGRVHPMRKRDPYGVWELFIPHVTPGNKYGYKIHTPHGTDMIKIDPYAQEFENPPAHASVISACDDAYKPVNERFEWTDQEWIERRANNKEVIQDAPMSIYEVHLPSWVRGEGNSYLKYPELASRLIDHLLKLNFTHVEFLPLAHHPFEGSWGYQISGEYAPYSRLGSADDFKYLIDELHSAGIGVFIDFVPAHFCKDDWGLCTYDGVPLYEYADPREGEHKGWGTLVFNYRRNEVKSFLLGAAYHWFRRYHIDGLRIDAVSSMLYKNYCRPDGEWVPNEFGGDANLEAIALLQEMNWVVHQQFPGVFMMAEEATSWKGVTDKDSGRGGLGFDAKWDLGWMNDMLSYLTTPNADRSSKHSKLTFRGLYVAHEKWILPLSHDEVVSGKGSLIDKCGYQGTPFAERLQTIKTLYTFQIGQPGRPLMFMGGEFGQGREWKESQSLDWHESEEDGRKRLMLYVADLLGLYRDEPALHKGDSEAWNFQWVDCDNASDSVVAFIRKYGNWYDDLLVICNFSNRQYYNYPVGVPHGGAWKVLLNSDDWKYGGTMKGPGNGGEVSTTQGGRLGWPHCLWMDVPPCGSIILKVVRTS